jgi:hypothetical protein
MSLRFARPIPLPAPVTIATFSENLAIYGKYVGR